MLKHLFFYLLLLTPTRGRSQLQATAARPEIDFISDTQKPTWIEKTRLHAFRNTEGTAMIFADIVRHRPAAVFMLGDVTAASSSNRRWRTVDRFLDSCRENHISVHGLLGNHDVLWSRRGGEKNFQKRFPDHIGTGYVCITDSVAVVMLNSNFKRLSQAQVASELHWYRSALEKLDNDPAIKIIIVSCHHAPYSNSLIVGSSKAVQERLVPAFLQTAKCRLFITGHSHNFERFAISGKDFLVIGGGGGLHQPLDTSAKRIPDLSPDIKPMYHYLSILRAGDSLILTIHFIKPDFSGLEEKHIFNIGF